MGMIIVFTVWFATGCAGSGAERRSGQADSPPPSPARLSELDLTYRVPGQVD
jgi:hypothetical protein